MRIDQQAPRGGRLVVVDEVGKMEVISSDFVEAVRALFDSCRCVVLATIPIASTKSHWLVDELRKRDDCRLFEVTSNDTEIHVHSTGSVHMDYLFHNDVI